METPKLEEAAPVEELQAPPPMLETKVEDVPELTGRGGSDHKAIQNTIRDLAHQYGWRAELEYSVEDGFVDVWLQNADNKIA